MKRWFWPFVTLVLGFSLGWFLKPNINVTSPITFESTPTSQPEYNREPAFSQSSENQDVVVSNTIPSNTANALVHQPTTDEDAPGSAADKFIRLLLNENYVAAIDYFQSIARRDFALAAAMKRDLLTLLKQQLNSSEFQAFNNITEYWLNSYYRDIDVLLLLAEANAAQSYYGEAISIYQLAFSYAGNDAELAKVDAAYAGFTVKRDALLTQQSAWFELQNFYEQIEQAGIASSDTLFRLAEIYAYNGYKEEARYYAEQLRNSRFSEKAQRLLEQLSDENMSATPLRGVKSETIALEKHGAHYLVNIQLPNTHKLKLLLDTGATMTSLSQSALNEKVGSSVVNYYPSRLFNTANGVVSAEVVELPTVYLGSFNLKNVKTAILPMGENQIIDGLLGMNVLSQFRFHIDQQAGELVLEKRTIN